MHDFSVSTVQYDNLGWSDTINYRTTLTAELSSRRGSCLKAHWMVLLVPILWMSFLEGSPELKKTVWL